MRTLLITIMLFSSASSWALVPKEAFTFNFNVEITNATRLKEEKLYQAIELLKKVFASEEFKRKVYRHTFKGRRAFAMNKGLTNRLIYKKILHGAEMFHPWNNNMMDLRIELFRDYKSNIIGFTRPGTYKVWMNEKYYNKYTPARIAANLTHEWLHKLGFDHEYENTPDRKYSVPYAVGYIVRELALKFEREDWY